MTSLCNEDEAVDTMLPRKTSKEYIADRTANRHR